MNDAIDKIIERMRNGEPLRWILKSSVNRLRPGCIDCRELWIGKDLVDDKIGPWLIVDPRIRVIEVNDPSNQAEFIDYELIE